MRLAIVGDCHGEKPELDEEEVRNAEAIIATGDICGDSSEIRSKMFEASEKEEKWYELMDREEAESFVERSIDEGREVLEYLNSFGKPVYLVPGNWDWYQEDEWSAVSERYEEIVSGFENVRSINFRKQRIGGHVLIGYGPCPGPEIPQYSDDEPESEGELEQMREEYRQKKERLEGLVKNAEAPVVLLSHNVPFDTFLDRIENADSPAGGRHYGSLIVREVIDELKPAVSVAGHIHEGYGREKLGETLCINAGLNSAVYLRIEEGEVKDAEFDPELSGP